MTRIAIVYVPVLHKGYVDFFDMLAAQGVSTLYLISDEVLASYEAFDYLNRKDRIRAVPVPLMRELLLSRATLAVELFDTTTARTIAESGAEIHMPREDISRHIAEIYFPNTNIVYHDVFVRRHTENVGEDKIPDIENSISSSQLQKKIFGRIHEEAEKSADWWRQVGAALVVANEIVFIAHNEHMPDEQLPNMIGDARSLFKKGIHINYVTSAHAEISVIAEAAKRGIPTDGAELYVTDFPCPYCARAIAKSGIKKVYFEKGYAVLDGDIFLKEEGVEVVQVKE